MKLRRRRAAEAIPTGYAAKASLRKFGSGTLELIDSTLKFYIETGYFKKRKEVVREIPVAEIESAKRVGNEFSITWKGVTDIFVIEEAELVDPV